MVIAAATRSEVPPTRYVASWQARKGHRLGCLTMSAVERRAALPICRSSRSCGRLLVFWLEEFHGCPASHLHFLELVGPRAAGEADILLTQFNLDQVAGSSPRAPFRSS